MNIFSAIKETIIYKLEWAFLKVERINFLVVPSTLMMLKVAQEYLQLCRALPTVALEAVQRLNHLLRLFNES